MITEETLRRSKLLRNTILIKCFLDQKSSYKIIGKDGKTINLWMDVSSYKDTNLRESSPSLFHVINVSDDIKDLAVGDVVLGSHNLHDNKGAIFLHNKEEESVIIRYDTRTDCLFCKIDNGEVYPLINNYIVERIETPDSWGRFSTGNVGTCKTNFKVLKIPVDEKLGVKPLDQVICYQYSDYEIEYMYDNKRMKCIKVNEEDILAIVNNETNDEC